MPARLVNDVEVLCTIIAELAGIQAGNCTGFMAVNVSGYFDIAVELSGKLASPSTAAVKTNVEFSEP